MTEDRITTKVANIFNIKTYYFSYPFEDMINIYYIFHSRSMLRFVKIPKHICECDVLTMCGIIKKELNEKLINRLIIEISNYEYK